MVTNLRRVLFLAQLLALVSSANAFYDPTVGRWLNRDPLGDEAFLMEQMQGKPFEEQVRLREESFKNPYRFVDNDPTNKFDPVGLQAIVGIYGFGPATSQFWLNDPSNLVVARIAGATDGKPFGRSQQGAIRDYIKSEYKKDPKKPIVIFGYSRGAVASSEVADWVIKNKEMPCARVFVVGIDPVTLTGPGPVRLNKKVEEFASWYQKNGGGWGPWKVITVNLADLDGTTMTGAPGRNHLITTGARGYLVNHAGMPEATESAVQAAINDFKNRPPKSGQ
jgi:RHS repeat-associated protein